MHSYLIIGEEKDRTTEIQNRIQASRVSPFDVIVINEKEPSIGIKDVREFIAKLQLIPSSSSIIYGIINDASRLTTEAQQALLKTLEEPPPQVRILLGISQQNVLLPTILSRCECVIINNKRNNTTAAHSVSDDFIENLLLKSPGQRLLMLSIPLKTKEESILFLNEALHILRKKLVDSSSFQARQTSTLISRLLKLYDTNQSSLNMQLLIESAFL